MLALVGLYATLIVVAEPHPLHGSWQLVEIKTNDATLKSLDPARFRLAFTKDKMNIYIDGKKEVATSMLLKLDDAPKTKLIDLTPTDGPNKDNPSEGLYEIKGDELRICLGVSPKERPTSFEVKEETPWVLIVLKREKE